MDVNNPWYQVLLGIPGIADWQQTKLRFPAIAGFYNQDHNRFFQEQPRFDFIRFNDFNPLSGSRKNRLIGCPNPAMSTVHRHFIRYLRLIGPRPVFSTGCRPGTSIVKDVARHRHSQLIYATDLKDAFQNVRLDQLVEVLADLHPDPLRENWTTPIRQFLERYCFSDRVPGLILGSPSSPDLFNLYADRLIDQPLSQRLNLSVSAQADNRPESNETPLTFSRYLDDLKFSSLGRIKQSQWEEIRRQIRQVVNQAGFQVNHPKSKVLDLTRGSVILNGIGLEYGGRLFLPRGHLRETRRLIDQALNQNQLNPKDKEVLVVRGRMQMFWQIARKNTQPPNGTEQMLIDHYRLFQNRFG